MLKLFFLLGQLVEEHDQPLGFLLLLLLRHALHRVRLLRLHPPRHRVDAVLHLPVLLGVRVRVAGVLGVGDGSLAAQQPPGGQQTCRITVAGVLHKTPHWEPERSSRFPKNCIYFFLLGQDFSDPHEGLPFSLQRTNRRSAAQCFRSVSRWVMRRTRRLFTVSPSSGLCDTSLRGGRI